MSDEYTTMRDHYKLRMTEAEAANLKLHAEVARLRGQVDDLRLGFETEYKGRIGATNTCGELRDEVERLQKVVADQVLTIGTLRNELGKLKQKDKWFEERESLLVESREYYGSDLAEWESLNPKPGAASACVCGQPDTPNVVHRTDGPCFWPESGTAT